MINLHEKVLPTRWESNPQSPGHQSDPKDVLDPCLVQSTLRTRVRLRSNVATDDRW